MNSSTLLHFIQKNNFRFLTFNDILPLYKGKSSAASRALLHLTRYGLLTKIKRGVWVNNSAADFRLEEILPAVVSPWPAYLSLHSALSEYGLIAEIPQVIYAVSLYKASRIISKMGNMILCQMPEKYFWGYRTKRINKSLIPIADPEKAILDTLYLSWTKRSPIQMPVFREKPHIDIKKLKQYAKKWNHKAVINYANNFNKMT
ncbi:MAG: hypothetical protein ABII23_02165 [bacterium]